MAFLPGISPGTYRPSVLHASERDWHETNCYTDVWIEILHAIGFDPACALSFTVEQDFEGDHFTFFKFPLEDLETLFGLRVTELAIYDSVEAQVAEQVARGRLPLVEADSFYLPDTAGTTYGLEHAKSTIAINAIDPAAKRMDYFHSAGFHTVSGDDYDGALGQLAIQRSANALFPYVEFVKFEPQRKTADLVQTSILLLRTHLAKRPDSNPIKALQDRLLAQAEMVAGRPPDFFHKYAFNTFRQAGANFELLGSHLIWLAAQGELALDTAIDACKRLSSEAKIMQFQLARAVMRKKMEGLQAKLDPMCDAYDRVMGELSRLYGGRG